MTNFIRYHLVAILLWSWSYGLTVSTETETETPGPTTSEVKVSGISTPETEVSGSTTPAVITTKEDDMVTGDNQDKGTVSNWVNGRENGTIKMPSGNDTENSEFQKSQTSNQYAIINQGTVSPNQYKTCSLVLNTGLKPIVCVGGVIMNAIGMCVLLQKRFRRSTYTYLCFLSFSDMCLLLCGLIRTIPKVVNFFDDVIANYIDVHLFPYDNMFFGSSFTRISEYIICALAIERFVAVLLPLKVKDLFLCRHALGICIGISTFCTLLHVQFMFIYYPKPYFNPSRNITLYALSKNPWYVDSGFRATYNIIYEILFLYIPLLILLTCNIGILLRVRQITKQRRNIVAGDNKNEKMSKDQLRMTLTLVIISLSFMSVFMPLVILTVIQKFSTDIKLYGREHYMLQLIIDVLSLGWNISSANDFIVYIYTSKQFKHTLVSMMCRKEHGSHNRKSLGPYSVDSKNFTNTTDATENHM